ncbi:hypothetical protein GJ744_005139 [Endocarpon pusillum]|uniref:Zn(2)-C6 fungal-type domain-containing protein n=1 Tax=Endocarpon pusillum TaxID=364733 RepID=A0A8H7E6L9_9EURO|nr:hypothetical protein GJ744_005139 [Endocarpon pusillum]
MSQVRPKRRRLEYDKCTYCRTSKKKCEPHTRDWPDQKCNRCLERELPCWENYRVRKTRAAAKNQIVHDGHVEGGSLRGGPHGTTITWAESGHHSCIKILLDHGANINHSTDKVDSALETASREGYEDVVRLLLEKWATDKDPALYKAAQWVWTHCGYAD